MAKIVVLIQLLSLLLLLFFCNPIINNREENNNDWVVTYVSPKMLDTIYGDSIILRWKKSGKIEDANFIVSYGYSDIALGKFFLKADSIFLKKIEKDTTLYWKVNEIGDIFEIEGELRKNYIKSD